MNESCGAYDTALMLKKKEKEIVKVSSADSLADQTAWLTFSVIKQSNGFASK